MSLREDLDSKLARFEELEHNWSIRPCWPTPRGWLPPCANMARWPSWPRSIAASKTLNAQITEAQEMIDGKDAEMREMAEAELPTLKPSAKRSGTSCST